MSQGLATGGYASIVGGTSGGGGGAGPSDVIVPFTLLDNTGMRASGVSTVTLAANIEIGIAGAPYDAALGTVTEVGNGDYFYTLDEDEAIAPGVFFKIELTGYFNDLPFSMFWSVEATPTNADLSTQISTSVATILSAILDEAGVAGAVWGAARSSYNGAGTFGEAVRANIIQWLGDAPAALTGANKYVQVALKRWLTDDANGTPLALDSNKVQATVSPDFNSDDRATLQGLRDDYTTERAALLDHLDLDISAVEASVDDAAVAAAVMNTIIEGDIRFSDAIRGIIAALVARATDVTTGTVVVKGVIDVGKTRWTITKDATGRLGVVKGDLT